MANIDATTQLPTLSATLYGNAVMAGELYLPELSALQHHGVSGKDISLPALTFEAKSGPHYSAEISLSGITVEAHGTFGKAIRVVAELPTIFAALRTGAKSSSKLKLLTADLILLPSAQTNIDTVLPKLQLSASATSGKVWQISTELRRLSMKAELLPGSIGSITSVLPHLRSSAFGISGAVLSISTTLPELSTLAYLTTEARYVGNWTLPIPIVYFEGHEAERFDEYILRYRR